MNPFEKIFNFQIISRLDEVGSLALTSQERSWLKTMLMHPASEAAFTLDTLSKLNAILEAEASTEVQGIIMEKAKSKERQVYHPMLRTLRRIIMQNQAILITFHIKHGGQRTDQTGFPHKLEYNMYKREWYLQWYSTRQRSLMSTKLKNIISVEVAPFPAKRINDLKARIIRLLEDQKECACIQVIPTFNAELSRILYAFSCFDKSVSFDENSGIYRIKVIYMRDDSEFLLSKIRFLGLRVKIVEGEHLKRRMLKSAAMAIDRYGE
ncbi:WYL domain-containing protein [Paenibacillus sp. FSL R7-0048]|jgi:predicted DNA-binding transcriptional regulator YafY|uniref:WYL domain-containing protein n=1 Tax=Paenibacillus TaxID=44249 RepID=UPI00096BF33D|nr:MULTISPECIES: WYL domain-containing protein [Paenibacillus]MDH6429565.1 putative DNA-binding transcriptional regulator YafY [Paenibacillus sp. PastH-4]MDH6445773.1 putative DNA-binding transcriptional regulator YafY [Paenibacillus sp. PastF-4]MDH6529660.1 putative DNA-binding transcriptional regulator YafY [Paenibacillus sp. PastH-3]OMC77118.1 WYL domain-containing protein [Paenibacillus odorifer]OMD60555.1 WYL domain-containing protein [Paenibacillus odorifer]